MKIEDLMQQAQGLQEKLQSQMQQMQEELSNLEVVGEAGAGLVKVTLNGRHEAKAVTLDPSLRDEPLDVVEDLIAAAITSAAQKLEQAQADSQADAMKAFTGGLGMPPGFKFPFPGS